MPDACRCRCSRWRRMTARRCCGSSLAIVLTRSPEGCSKGDASCCSCWTATPILGPWAAHSPHRRQPESHPVYRLVYFVLGAAMLAEFFSTPGVHGGPNFGVLPSPLRFLPEAMTGIVAVYVLFAGVRKQFHRIPVKYWFLFGALSLILVCGILANDEATGPVLNGMRYYLRAIPVFFLPAILEMTDEQLRRVLRYVTGLALLQTPISMYQRYVLESGGHSSGDGVSGSLMDSGAMTLIL